MLCALPAISASQRRVVLRALEDNIAPLVRPQAPHAQLVLTVRRFQVNRSSAILVSIVQLFQATRCRVLLGSIAMRLASLFLLHALLAHFARKVPPLRLRAQVDITAKEAPQNK